MQGGGLTIREMCESARVSRASYYRSWRKQEPKQEQNGAPGCHSAVGAEASALRLPSNRKIVEARDGWLVNHKRVLRLMGDDNLLKYSATTICGHNRQRAPVGGCIRIWRGRWN